MSDYTIIIERGPRNYSAYCPDVPGCAAAAKTRAKTEKLMREALELHIQFLRETGDAIPAPTSRSSLVRVCA